MKKIETKNLIEINIEEIKEVVQFQKAPGWTIQLKFKKKKKKLET